jgi:hypothetical protein
MKKIVIIFLIFQNLLLFGQEDLSKQKNLMYQDEISFGIKLSTNGWGMDFRRGYFVNVHKKKLYEIGFNTIHHPKEYRESSIYYLTKTFVYGKMNLCYDIKAGIGRQYMLFDKKEPGSVAIRIILTTGLDIAFLKPIYYKIIINQQNGASDYEKYNPAHQPAYVIQKAPFTMGLSETKIDPGIYLKLGTSFEHSKKVNIINSLELGVEAYYFLYKPQIMAEVNNPQFIVSLFMSYRLGHLMKNHHKKEKKSY